MNNLLSNWHKDLSKLYIQYNNNILQYDGIEEYSKPIHTELSTISKANKSKSFMRDLYLFKIINRNNNLHLIGQIVYKQMECDSDEIKKADNYVKQYIYDIDSIQLKIRYCIHMMEYVRSIHPYVHIEEWRDHNKTNKLSTDIKNKLYHANDIILDSDSKTDSLFAAYKLIKDSAYDSLLVTAYVRFISEDIDEQNDVIIDILSSNISRQLDDNSL